MSHLPADQPNNATNYLSAWASKHDRSDAISFLYVISDKGVDSKTELHKIIAKEQNPGITSNAIVSLHSLDAESFGEPSKKHLTELLKNKEVQTQIEMDSLITKTRLFEIDNNIQQDIIYPLNSSAQTFQ